MLPYPIQELSGTMMELRAGKEIPVIASFPAEPFLFFLLFTIQPSMLIALPLAP